MLSNNFRGAIYLMLSMAGFTINDSIIKSIGNSINLGQIILVRGFVACFFLYLLLRYYGLTIQPDMLSNRIANARMGFEILATLAFLTALMHLPFANISAIMQALPLAVTVGAVLFFSEHVGWHRWIAILFGLGGVLLIIRPGMAEFSSYSLLVVFVVIAAAARDLLTRILPASYPSLTVSLLTSVVITLTGAALVLPLGGWQSMDALTIIKLICSASFVICGYQFIILAMRTGEVSSIAPFRYTSLLWAIGLGYFFFSEIPDQLTLAGSAIVVLTGIYTLYRERVVAQVLKQQIAKNQAIEKTSGDEA